METQIQNSTARVLFLQSVGFTPSSHFEAVPGLTVSPLAARAAPRVPCSPSQPFTHPCTPAHPAHPAPVHSLRQVPLTHFEAHAQSTTAPRLAGSPGAEGGGDAAAPALLQSSGVGLPSFGQMAYLKAGDTQQYMYRLRGKQPAAQLRAVSALGRMEVVWKSQMGESGHLQSNAVQRKLPTPRSVEVRLAAPSPPPHRPLTPPVLQVSVVSVADEVLLETPFQVDCLVTNTSSKELHLQLRFEQVPTCLPAYLPTYHLLNHVLT